MKLKISLLLLLIIFTINIQAQKKEKLQKATLTKVADSMIEIPSISAQIANGKFIPAENWAKEFNPKKRGANKSVPGKGLPKGNDPLWKNQIKANKIKGSEPILVFEAASSNATPTDPTGAVGPNHFINAWNSSFRIWDKEGNPLTYAASLSNIFPGETLGDPIVLYDPFADRFLITEFTDLNGFLVAICQGHDPVNDGWYTYYFSTNTFPDYPKFSIWSDGYYITANKNSSTAGYSEVVFAIERDKIILGDPDAQMIGFPLPGISTSGFYSPLGFNANGNTLPEPGNAPIVYMQDDSWSGVSVDHLKIWNINVDWENPDSSTISEPQIIETEPFDGLFDGGSFSNLPQPTGSDIDALQATIMFMAQYRKFSTHNSVVFNFVVDLDGNDTHAGIRWYELRQPASGQPWSIYQEGTYSQPDGHSAFSGNMCMDANGNIALAYTTVSENLYPSLRYTGRFANDELGIMTIQEDTIVNGYQSDPYYRYGDYSQMTIDPTDDMTFWSISEYFAEGTRKNQVGVFSLSPTFSNDVGIVSINEPIDRTLSANEPITVTIKNFGIESQYDIPVSYQIDSNTIVYEILTDTLRSNESLQYTFETSGDFSMAGKMYKISAFTKLSNELYTDNDTATKFITNLHANEIGVVEIVTPVSGTDLTENEPISVTIKNYGGTNQSNFDVSYTINNELPVTEKIEESLQRLATMTYTFNTTANFSNLGDYQLKISTQLTGDADTSNDKLTTIITKTLCMPVSDCSLGRGIKGFKLGTIDNTSECDTNGYNDNTDLITNLYQRSSNELILTTGHGNQFFKIWIDFNNNFLFETDEIVVNNYKIAPDKDEEGVFIDTIYFDIPQDAQYGEHLLRAKTNYAGGVYNDACISTEFGETEDYLVNILYPLSINNDFDKNELTISSDGQNHFFINYTNENINEILTITVHNIMGQTLVQNRVAKTNGDYEYFLDMSYATPGVYLLNLSSSKFGKVKRIFVK